MMLGDWSGRWRTRRRCPPGTCTRSVTRPTRVVSTTACERGIELWLEGRRAADLRRWAETPGVVPFEVVRLEASGQSPSEDERRNVLEFYDEADNLRPAGAGLCLPVSENEINSNPNL